MSEARRTPAHAGRLQPWEQCVFAMVFAVMASYVLVVSVSAARGNIAAAAASGPAGNAVSTAAGHSGHGRAGSGRSGATRSGLLGTGKRGPGRTARDVRRPSLDARLAAALRPIIRQDDDDVAVGVLDVTTGDQASYHAGWRFHAASVENTDMLAALLLASQRAGILPSSYGTALASVMMQDSDNDAANGIWDLDGGQAGLLAANRALGLRDTRLGPAGYWGLTSTTVTDQLRLLAELTGTHSPLRGALRRYALSLMRTVAAGQRWGVCAAASPGTSCAVRNGWVPDPERWVVNSTGVIRVHGQQLLIAVLSKGSTTEADGIGLVQAVAVAAAQVMTESAG